MVINHLEKLFVTNDAATIIKELEVSLISSNVIYALLIVQLLVHTAIENF